MNKDKPNEKSGKELTRLHLTSDHFIIISIFVQNKIYIAAAPGEKGQLLENVQFLNGD
jgi:hypothetical protein